METKGRGKVNETESIEIVTDKVNERRKENRKQMKDVLENKGNREERKGKINETESIKTVTKEVKRGNTGEEYVLKGM